MSIVIFRRAKHAWGWLTIAWLGLACGTDKATSAESIDASTPLDSATVADSTAATGSAANASDAAAQEDGDSADACPSGPPTSVPAEWQPPEDCGGVGNLCSEGCGDVGGCQLLGEVCVPFSRVGASQTTCTPYCLAYACMDFDEASCFCTGSASAEHPSCACGPEAVAGLCASEGASCETLPCCNCQGLQCVSDPESGLVCRAPCSAHTDCATGCCNIALGVCQDALLCNCVDDGAACTSAGPYCCPGTTCLTYSGDTANGPFSCYPDCTTQDECSTGCCSPTIPGLTHGVCGPCS